LEDKIFQINEDIEISGYNIKGLVTSKNLGMEDVEVSLVEKNLKKEIKTKTNKNGEYIFKGILSGDYEIVPVLKVKIQLKKEFKFTPNKENIQVKESSLVVKEFKLTGLTAYGQVTDKSNKGVENVEIYINSIKRAQTNSNGEYQINDLEFNKYKIEAKKENMEFETLSNYEVKENKIQTMMVTKHKICGKVILKKKMEREFKVEYFDGLNKNTINTDVNGEFCFYSEIIKEGNVEIKVNLEKKDVESGLIILPANGYKINIKNGPILVFSN
jgi:hypothetical protein